MMRRSMRSALSARPGSNSLVLARSPTDAPRDERTAKLLTEAALSRGLANLPWPADIAALRERIAFLRRHDPTWPDLSDAALTERAGEWLLPAFTGKRRLAELSSGDLRNAFAALLPWPRMAELERLAPAEFSAPSGRVVPIDYSSGEPVVRLAVQNLFGLARHPAVLGGAVPILFELLSPAQRPIQVTRDLPGFWRGSWRDVRADMRGRYPKHFWPEDPAAAEPAAGREAAALAFPPAPAGERHAEALRRAREGGEAGQRRAVARDHPGRHFGHEVFVRRFRLEGAAEFAFAQERQDAGRDAAADIDAAARHEDERHVARQAAEQPAIERDGAHRRRVGAGERRLA